MNKPQLIELPRIFDPRGNLSFIQNGPLTGFDIKRCYWIYDVPGGQERHGHAFRTQSELIVALAGSFDVVLDDGNGPVRYHMARSYYALRVPPMTWRSIDNFSTCSVAMVLSSTTYDPADYIEDYDLFKTLAANTGNVTVPSTEVAQPVPPVTADAHSRSNIDRCGIIDLPRHRHPNGSLSVVENVEGTPFDIKRVFYLYDVPGDSERGGHSHHEARELIVAVSGSFDVTLDDGHQRRVYSLNRPYKALYVEPGIWRSLDNFSSGSVSLVLTSQLFDEADYVRDYDRFKQLTAIK
ncbi:MAG: FdtA/QdtA family cupin domain-containing protein, partial [Muribaculaceae bacterium]|nr:FdtA/QdtA family cupin domain-containing protein [Muribaculaceae bacterium]